jgi:hypothetical protein
VKDKNLNLATAKRLAGAFVASIGAKIAEQHGNSIRNPGAEKLNVVCG